MKIKRKISLKKIREYELFVGVATAGTAAVATAAAVCNHSRRRAPASARVCPADTTEQCRAAE